MPRPLPGRMRLCFIPSALAVLGGLVVVVQYLTLQLTWNCTPWWGSPFWGRNCPPGSPQLLGSSRRRAYDSGLHRTCSGQAAQLFASFCTIYNSEIFIFILLLAPSPSLMWVFSPRSGRLSERNSPGAAPAAFCSAQMLYPAAQPQG